MSKSNFAEVAANYRKVINGTVLFLIIVFTVVVDRANDPSSKVPDSAAIFANLCFTIAAVSVHNLLSIGFEMGLFSYFLGSFCIQLLKLHWITLFVIPFIFIIFFANLH